MNKSTRERSDGGDAFIPESAQISGTPDDLAEFSGNSTCERRLTMIAGKAVATRN